MLRSILTCTIVVACCHRFTSDLTQVFAETTIIGHYLYKSKDESSLSCHPGFEDRQNHSCNAFAHIAPRGDLRYSCRLSASIAQASLVKLSLLCRRSRLHPCIHFRQTPLNLTMPNLGELLGRVDNVLAMFLVLQASIVVATCHQTNLCICHLFSIKKH